MSATVPVELDLPASLRRHPFAAAFVFALVVALTAVIIFFAPRKFRSSAKLLLKIGPESVSVDPTAASVGDPLSVHLTREHEMQTALGIMQSREILTDVVDDIGVKSILSPETFSADSETSKKSTPKQTFSLSSWLGGWVPKLDPIPDEERAVRELEKDLYVDASGESSVVNVGFTTDSPELAQAVVDSWMQQFIHRQTEIYHDENSLTFFEQQSDKIRAGLEKARQTLSDAKMQYGLVTVEGQQALLEEQLAAVTSHISEVEAEIAATTQRVKAYDQMLTSAVRPTIQTEVSGKANEGRDDMRTQLFALELEQKNLQSKLTEGHPKILAIRRQLEEARSIISDLNETRNEITYAANPAYQILSEERMKDEAMRQGLAEKRESLLQRAETISEEFSALNEHEGELAAMIEEVRIYETRYSQHADRLEQARMNDVLAASDLTSVSIVQAPTLQYRPVSPNKPIVAVTGLAAALASALALPALLDQRRRRRMIVRGELDETWDFESKQADADQDALDAVDIDIAMTDPSSVTIRT